MSGIVTPSPLPDGAVGSAYSESMTASGILPYPWDVAYGLLPAGLSLSASGVISGTPTTAGVSTFNIEVTDSSTGDVYGADFSLTIDPSGGGSPPSITTSSLPGATTGTAYDQTLAVSGGTSPYAFAIISGALPSGITINVGTGEISGTPTAAGTYSFTVRVTDSASLTGTASLSIVVSTPSVPPSITTSSLPGGTTGTAYDQTLATSGGTAPLAFAITLGALPSGITMNTATGEIMGVPSAAGTFAFTVRVTDAVSLTGTANLSIVVTAPAGPPSITTTSLPGGALSSAYSQAIAVSGGTAPLVFAISVGVLPAGLSINTGTGTISGTPSAVGSSSFTVTVTDAASLTGSAAFTIVVGIVGAPLAGGTIAGAINPMRASGGIAPVVLAEVQTAAGKVYRWSERDLANTSSLLTPATLAIASITTTYVRRPVAGGGAGITYYYLVVTLAAAATIPNGIAIVIAGCSNPAWNGSFEPVNMTSPTTFQVQIPAALAGLSGSGGTVTFIGAPGSYKGWIVGQPRFTRTGTMQTDTGSFAIQNYSGNTVTRDAATFFSADEFINALCVCRLWRTDAEVALFTMIGTITEADMSETQLNFSMESFGNWSAVPAPACKIDPTCPLFFGSTECGSTATTPCQNTFGTCSSVERFKGFLTQWTWANQGIPVQQIAQPAPPISFNPKRAF